MCVRQLDTCSLTQLVAGILMYRMMYCMSSRYVQTLGGVVNCYMLRIQQAMSSFRNAASEPYVEFCKKTKT